MAARHPEPVSRIACPGRTVDSVTTDSTPPREGAPLPGLAPVGHDRAIGLWARPRAGAIWAGVWLVYLLPSFAEAVSDHHAPPMQVLGVALLVTFIALYIRLMIRAWGMVRPDAIGEFPAPMNATSWRLFATLIAISVAATAVIGEPAAATFVFLAPVSSSLLPARFALPAIGCAVVAVCIAEVVGRRYGGDVFTFDDALSSGFGTAMAGLITFGIRRMRGVMWELDRARGDVERLATAQERVRIARDLHDVLGHSLTVISVKSQLAARLVERGEMDRAGTEIREVEVLSRSAMADVREAVAGYRARTLAAELAAAEVTLDSAGIAVTVQRSAEGVPVEGEDALGFVVREGVTNVLRHSRARTCAIEVRHTADSVVVELVDDGGGAGQPLHAIDPAAGADGPSGNGLRGLAERVAVVGGRLSAGDGPAGGFVLRAEVGR